MTYICPALKYAADTYLMNLQCLQYKVARITGKFPRSTPICEMHTAFQIPYVYDFVTK
jgi:hypothetical protein